jgi:hypothetical protein
MITPAANETVLAIARPRVAGLNPTVVVAGCLMFALVLFLPAILNDGDTLWQIRTGEWILNHHAIPAVDPFSFTAGDRPWSAHEWLAETLMALAFRMGGMRGVIILAAVAAGLTAAVLLHHLRRFLPGVYALTALIVALANAAPSMLARPHLLAWPCLALWCGGLVTARARHTAPSFLLLPVMLLWVNLHGSFMLGLMLSGAFMIEALFDPDADHHRVISSWTLFIVAACAVTLLNPDALAGELFPFHLVGMKSLTWIGEWTPTDFSRIQPLEITLLAGVALGFSGKVRLPPTRLLMLVGFIHGALSHARNGQLLGIVGGLILAEPFGRCLARDRVEAPDAAWLRPAAVVALVALTAALAGRIALPLGPERTGAAFIATLELVPPSLRARPVLNEYGLGGELIFNGVRPFIDSRADLYGDAFLSHYRRIVSPDRAELERALSKYGIAWTIFPSDYPVVQILNQEPGWRRLVEVDGIVIHERENWQARGYSLSVNRPHLAERATYSLPVADLGQASPCQPPAGNPAPSSCSTAVSSMIRSGTKAGSIPTQRFRAW